MHSQEQIIDPLTYLILRPGREVGSKPFELFLDVHKT